MLSLNKLNLISLLPQSPQTIIGNNDQAYSLLSLYQYIVYETLQTFEHILTDEWWFFDPQVGENQCQIRAYQFFLLAQKLSLPEQHAKLIIQYNNLKKIYALILEKKNAIRSEKINTFTKNKSLIYFFADSNLLYTVSEEVVYLTQCKFLTIFGKKDNNEMYTSIDYVKLCASLKISKTIARKIVHQYQLDLSQASCDFVLSLLKNNAGLTRFKQIMPSLNFHDEENRSVLPLFFTSEILVRAFSNHSGYIVLDVKDDNLNNKKYCFMISGNKIIYKWRLQKPDLSHYCIVLKTKTLLNLAKDERIFIQTMITNFKSILLANEAAHPQYPGKSLSCVKTDPFEQYSSSSQTDGPNRRYLRAYFHKMKKYAETFGCTQQNPSTLFIEHIFCSTVAKEFNQEFVYKTFEQTIKNSLAYQ